MSALGLADYGSSDEEEDSVVAPPPPPPVVPKAADAGAKDVAQDKAKGKDAVHIIQSPPPPPSQPQQQSLPQPDNSASIGPALGPAPGPTMPSDLARDTATLSEDGVQQPPASPYTANRQLVRNLTMPPVPNFEIPPSPPASPPAATTAKFTRFLELKTKGLHFNERLHDSSALRNPGLLGKLMDFAGITKEDQYASALPETLSVPTKFPEWAYADKLVKEHERIAKRKEEEKAKMQRDAIDFVPAKRVEVEHKSAPVAANAIRAGEKSRGRSDRPEAKRSRFDEGDRPGVKKSRFDERDDRR